MRERTPNAPRGAAVVETALGITVLVTVILFGVHFSEVMWISMKAQEAMAAAKWDATSLRIHNLPGDYKPVQSVPENTAKAATERYRDYDGRSSTRRSGQTGLKLSNTQAGELEVTCELATDVRYPLGPLPPRLGAVYQDAGGIKCKAQADAWLIRIPERFADASGSLFKEKHVTGKNQGQYRACSFGKPFAKDCPEGPTLMLGDWGLAGYDEGQECWLSAMEDCPNMAYYRSVQKAYEVGGKAKGTAAMVLARSVVGQVPIDPNQFWFSFRGEESQFLECTPPTMGHGPNKFETSPGLNSQVPEYDESYKMRGNCAMGWPAGPTGQCPERGW